MSDGVSSKGIKMKVGDTESSGTSFSDVSEIIDINFGGKTRTAIDIINQDSPGGYSEFKSGFRNAGEITFTMNFTRDQYITLDDIFESDSLREFQVVVPDDGETTFEFWGLMTNLVPFTAPFEDRLVGSCTVQISGQPTLSS